MIKIKKYNILIFNSLTRETTWETVYDSTFGNAIQFAKLHHATKTLRSMCNSFFSRNDVVNCLSVIEAKED